MINKECSNNIVLIGMPGTGKTTVGMLLSETLNYGVIDTDILINDKTGKTPKQIVEQFSREYFMAIQDEVVLNLKVDNCVISTGGGIVHSETAMNYLRKLGKIIFLQTSYKIIEDRMDISRKLVKTGGSLQDLYNERTPLYNKYADTVIECDNSDPQKICQEIIKYLEV